MPTLTKINASQHQKLLQCRLKWLRKDFAIDVALAFGAGTHVLFGPSGSGKTTLLRFLAGLDKEHGEGVDKAQFSGQLSLGDDVWFNAMPPLHGNKQRGYKKYGCKNYGCKKQRYKKPSHLRAVGYVFQQPTLLPHLTVQHNLHYAKKRAGGPSKINEAELIAQLDLAPLLDKMPHELSGGEAQRACLARALLCQPQVLLLDEPLSALDIKHKRQLLDYMSFLFASLNIPVVYVTHSLDEVARLADTLTVLEQGAVKRFGPVQEVLGDLAVAKHLGRDACVMLQGHLCDYPNNWGLAKLSLGAAALYIPADALPGELHQANQRAPTRPVVRFKINASDISLALTEPTQTSIQNCLEGCVVATAVDATEAFCFVHVRVEQHTLIARLTRKSLSEMQLKPGTTVFVLVKSVVISG